MRIWISRGYWQRSLDANNPFDQSPCYERQRTFLQNSSSARARSWSYSQSRLLTDHLHLDEAMAFLDVSLVSAQEIFGLGHQQTSVQPGNPTSSSKMEFISASAMSQSGMVSYEDQQWQRKRLKKAATEKPESCNLFGQNSFIHIFFDKLLGRE